MSMHKRKITHHDFPGLFPLLARRCGRRWELFELHQVFLKDHHVPQVEVDERMA